MRILLVEDDQMIGASIQRGLTRDGFTVDWVSDGSDAELALSSASFELMLLDLGLPGMSGMALLNGLRRAAKKTLLIVVTARDAVADRVAALDAGADDYIIKPFHLVELAARIRAVARRSAGNSGPMLEAGELALNPLTHEVVFRGQKVFASPREFAVLHALMRNPEAPLSREQLEEQLYGWNEEVESNAVEVHIHHLRKKLSPDLIRTVRGVGYVLGGSV